MCHAALVLQTCNTALCHCTVSHTPTVAHTLISTAVRYWLTSLQTTAAAQQALALLESCVGFALEHLGKLPVAQARVAARGLDCEFTHLDLGGLRASRTDVDLAMLGVRLPRRGARVCTPMGTGEHHQTSLQHKYICSSIA